MRLPLSIVRKLMPVGYVPIHVVLLSELVEAAERAYGPAFGGSGSRDFEAVLNAGRAGRNILSRWRESVKLKEK